jgi:Arc/MetJ-type ribon-helix-helix transcriptional regulator
MTDDSERITIGGTIEPKTLKAVDELVKTGRFRNKSHLVDEALKYYIAHIAEIDEQNGKGGNGNAPTN